jgi:hypothetical protein
MKPHIDTWIGKAWHESGMTVLNTTITKGGETISVSSSDIADANDPRAIGLSFGLASVSLDADMARAFAQAILAAADHRDTQLAARAAKAAS